MTEPMPAGFQLAPPEAELWSTAARRAVAESWAQRVFDRDPVALVERSRGPGHDRRPARVAQRAPPLPRAGAGDRGLRRGDPERRLQCRDRGRDGRQQPRPGGPPPDVRGAARLARHPRPRLDRSGGGQRDRGLARPALDPVHRGQQVGHDDRAARLPGRRLGPDPGRPGCPARASRAPRHPDGGDHRPGQEPRGDPPQGRSSRGLPEPARHRRPLLGPDLRRAGPGQPDRACRSRSCSIPPCSCSTAAGHPTRPPTRAWASAWPWAAWPSRRRPGPAGTRSPSWPIRRSPRSARGSSS